MKKNKELTFPKTLKDIECGHVETNWISGECIDGYPAVNRYELKQEAIKHIKSWEEDITFCKPSVGDCGEDIPNTNRYGLIAKKEAFIDFFNITDDDLTKLEEKQ